MWYNVKLNDDEQVVKFRNVAEGLDRIDNFLTFYLSLPLNIRYVSYFLEMLAWVSHGAKIWMTIAVEDKSFKYMTQGTLP